MANGMHFRSTVLSQGGSKDCGQLYRDFTGREARLEPYIGKEGVELKGWSSGGNVVSPERTKCSADRLTGPMELLIQAVYPW